MRWRLPSFFVIKKTGDAIGNFNGYMCPLLRFSSRISSSCFCSTGVDLSAEHLGIRYKFNSVVPLLPIRQFIKRLFGKHIPEFLVPFGYNVFEMGQLVVPRHIGKSLRNHLCVSEYSLGEQIPTQWG